MSEPSWYAKFVYAWRADKLTPFGPMTQLEACYLHAHWQVHRAQMADFEQQLERFARNVTGILAPPGHEIVFDSALDVESDLRLGPET